ncbi:MAG: hypothetical protein GWP62_07875, partial [Gammaproteobacteria bacterium]|nr:hypothetical protein [Gammaproteobacteria bacterium]
MVNVTPRRLIARLIVYYVLFIGIVSALLLANSEFLKYMPFGGNDALELAADFEVTETSIKMPRELLDVGGRSETLTPEAVAVAILFLSGTMLTAILVMIPVTWTYTATRFDAG